MQNKIETFWNEAYVKGTDYQDVSESLFNKILNHTGPAKNFLDLGCGTGKLMRMFEQSGLETVGVEISQEAIKLAKENGTKGEILQGNLDEIENVNIDKKFDLISIKLVLAFVKNRASLLDWCLKHLAENGKVIVNSPVSTKEKPCLKPGIDINLLEIETLLGFVFRKVELLDVGESLVGPVHTYLCSN